MIIIKYGNRRKLVVMLLLQMVVGLLNLLVAYVISGFVEVATTRDLTTFYQILTNGLVGFLVFGLLNYFAKVSQIAFIKDLNQTIKNKLVAYYLAQESQQTSEILSLLTNDMKQLETNGIKAEITIISNSATFLFAFVGALSFDVVTTLVFVVFSFLPFIVSKLTAKRIALVAKKWSTENGRYTQSIKGIFSGMSTIITYQAQPYAEKQAAGRIEGLERSLAEMDQQVAVSDSIMVLVSWLTSIILSFGFGIYRIMLGLLSLSSFMGVLQLSNSFSYPLIQIMQLRNQLATVTEIKAKIATAFAYQKDSESAEPVELQKLDLQAVTVKMKDKSLLKATSLTIKAQEKILISAPSGFGKSTLLKVLQRQLPMATGNYLINGQSVLKQSRLAVQKQFAMIQQTPFMFADTLRLNLTLGQAFTEDELAEVIEQAGLKELIAEKGLDYVLGENNSGLSGGQIQRLEIGRALLRKRPVLLVDEGTSSLDRETTELIRKTLSIYPGTVIEVGHKFSPEELKGFERVVTLS